MRYNWQSEEWPNFTYGLSDDLYIRIYCYGKGASFLVGQLAKIDPQIKEAVLVDLMVEEAIKTSAIEGEYFHDREVRASLQYQLGLSDKPVGIKDLRAISLAQLMIDVRKTFYAPLTAEMMFGWHELILSDPLLRERMTVGQWRTGFVQVVAWSMGKRSVLFEAPPPERVPQEMEQFIRWFNDTDPQHGSIKMSGPVRSALVHIYFESLHPFDDGNGRVGRILSEKALSQDLNNPVLFSLSNTIYARRQEYYKQLSLASGNSMTVTSWIEFFVDVVLQAQADAEQQITDALQKTDFLNQHETVLNDRQRQIIRKMLDGRSESFLGGMSAQKYMSITGCSKATATRDLSELLHQGCFEQGEGRGRGVRYALSLKKGVRI